MSSELVHIYYWQQEQKKKKVLLFWTPGNAFITKGYGRTLLAMALLNGKNSFSHFFPFCFVSSVVVLSFYLFFCFLFLCVYPSRWGRKLMEVISYAKSFDTVYQFDLMKYLEFDFFLSYFLIEFYSLYFRYSQLLILFLNIKFKKKKPIISKINSKKSLNFKLYIPLELYIYFFKTNNILCIFLFVPI